jgi:nicotinate-nucleotide pyrophosphorylase (carboxylating)
MAQAVAAYFDPAITLRIYLEDGAAVKEGDIAFNLMGPTRSILQVERILLNFMQRMSGIATLTHRFVDAVEGTGCRVLDTRKTTPGLRAIEKWAVRLGGGHNHRMGLYDMIMIKDNHHDFAGGIPKAIASGDAPIWPAQARTCRSKWRREIWTRWNRCLATGGVQRIMLDNFTPKLMRQAVELIDRRFETEASGGITLATARSASPRPAWTSSPSGP